MHLVILSAAYVRKRLMEELPKGYHYHDINHTELVVAAARMLAAELRLSEEEQDMLLFAAWFHDVGMIHGHERHEAQSILMAKDFLRLHRFRESEIAQAVALIDATRDRKPKSLLAEALCDADMVHLSRDDYFERAELLRKEWNATGRIIPESEFWHQTKQLFAQHRYFTPFAQQNWQAGKEKNYLQIIQKWG